MKEQQNKQSRKNKQKKRKTTKRSFDFGILFPLGILIAFIIFSFIGMTQWGFEKLINTLVFSILFRVSITLICLFGVFYKKQKYLRLKNFEIILLSITIILNWIFAFNPIKKLNFGLYFLYALVFGVLYVVFHLRSKNNNPDYDHVNINKSYTMCVYMFFIVAFIINFLQFNFENSSLLKGLWIALAMAVGIAALICFFPAREEMAGYPKWGKILMIFGMYFISIIISFAIIFSINYCFDFNEPTHTAYEILEKDVKYNGARSPSTHEVKVNKNGKEIWIVISQEKYYTVEVGDDIMLTDYKGALGIAYSLPKD